MRNTRRHTIYTGLLLLLVALAVSVLAGCGNPTVYVVVTPTPGQNLKTPNDPKPVKVLAGQATTLELGGGADLIIPPGAVTPGAMVAATYKGRPDGNWTDIVPTFAPVELSTNPPDAIHGLLTLEFPVPVDKITPGIDPALQFGISTYNPATKTWTPFTSSYDASRHMVVALIAGNSLKTDVAPGSGASGHVLSDLAFPPSWWNPYTWDWAGIGANINQGIGQLVHRRAAPPTCKSAPPAWVNLLAGVTSDAAVAIRSCAQAQGNVLDVELVNNRPYGMVLQYGAPVKWGWHQEGDSAKDKLLYQLADALIGHNQLYLPPLGRASVGIYQLSPGANAIFKIAPSSATLFVDFIDHAADYVLGKIPDVGGCASWMASFVPDFSPGGIRDNMVSSADCMLDEYKLEAAEGLLDHVKLDQLESTVSGLEKATVVGDLWTVYGIEWQLADLFVDTYIVGDNGPTLGAGFSVLAHSTTTSPPPPHPNPTPTPAPPHPHPTPTPVPPTHNTYAETAGPPSGSGTFTNYTNAGGTIGQRVAAYQTIQVTCRLTGFKVADGNTWWYKIASSPWSNTFYAPADNFYNNGATSGSLSGTPFVDTNVPMC